MISRIGVENFQGFLGKQSVSLAPITLIFGPNASGKSSISRAIRLFKQTLIGMPAGGWNGRFAFNGSDVRLKNLQRTISAAVAGESEQSHMDIECEFTVVTEALNLEGIQSFSVRLREVSLEGTEEHSAFVKVTLLSGETLEFRWNQFEESWETWGTVDVFFDALTRANQKHSGNLFFFEDEKDDEDSFYYEKPTPTNRIAPWSLLFHECVGGFLRGFPHHIRDRRSEAPKNPQGFLPEVVDLRSTWDTLKEVIPEQINEHWNTFEDFENSFDQLEDGSDSMPSYTKGDRERLWLMQEFFDVLRKASRSACLEITATETTRQERPYLREIDSPEQVDDYGSDVRHWLSELTDGRYDARRARHRVENDQDFEKSIIIDTYTSAEVDSSNVGAGLSQLIPILEAAFSEPVGKVVGGKRVGQSAAGVNRTLLIEQPELHLHPRMQSDVADMFIAAWTKNGSQFLIETHSESLLLRLQKRVREGKIRQEDVAIVYVESDTANPDSPTYKKRNIMYNLALAGNGDVLDPFPESFANLRLMDLL